MGVALIRQLFADTRRMSQSFLNRMPAGRRPRDASPQCRWDASLRSSDGNADTHLKKLVARPRVHAFAETAATMETASPRAGVNSLSDAQVVDELQKHHATAGKANNELSIKDARKFLTHVLRSTTTLAVTDPRFERAMQVSPSRRVGSPHKKRAAKGNQKPRVPPPVVNTVLQRCKAAGMTDSYFWRQLDRDMSNSVTKGEFEQGLKLVRLYLEQSELAALFQYFDSDSSGSIDFTEFQHAMGNKHAMSDVPRWDTSNVARYRKEEEAAATMSPRMRTPHFKEGEHRNTVGRKVELKHAEEAAWYGVTNLGSELLNHKTVLCRKPDSSAPHDRWSSMLRAPINAMDPDCATSVTARHNATDVSTSAPFGHGTSSFNQRTTFTSVGVRSGAHPDGHLLTHKLADKQEVQRVQGRHESTELHQTVPRSAGSIKDAAADRQQSPRRLSNSSALGNKAAAHPQVQNALKRMKKHGVDFFYLFKRFDLDQTGLVSIDEFKQGMRHIQLTIPPKELTPFLWAFDPQSIGKINYEDLQCSLRSTSIGSKNMRAGWSVGSPRHSIRGAGQFEQSQGASALSTPRLQAVAAPLAVAAPVAELHEYVVAMEQTMEPEVIHTIETPVLVDLVEETEMCCRMLGLCNGREDFGVLRSFGWSADGSLERPL